MCACPDIPALPTPGHVPYSKKTFLQEIRSDLKSLGLKCGYSLGPYLCRFELSLSKITNTMATSNTAPEGSGHSSCVIETELVLLGILDVLERGIV